MLVRVCISVLRAVNEDSPNVPNLLTEYILNGKCGLDDWELGGKSRVGMDGH